MHHTTPPALWLFFMLVPIVGMIACAVLARSGGWADLARRYPGGGHGEGRRFGIVSASLSRPRHLPVGYNNCLTLSVGPRGFRLSTFFLVRFQHPPIFVPWIFVDSLREERRWFVTMTTVDVRGVSTRLRFSGRPALALREEFARYQQQMRRQERK